MNEVTLSVSTPMKSLGSFPKRVQRGSDALIDQQMT